MPATNDSTFDLDPPRRPALADLGGAQKANHPKRPPDPVKHPTAEEWNHFAKLLAKLGAIVPLARVYVRMFAGSPSIQNVVTMRGDFTAADFTLVNNGTGDTELRWVAPGRPGSKLPPTIGAPSACVVDATIDAYGFAIRTFYTDTSGTPGVRVKTVRSSTDVAVAVGFVVDIH
jgi:hypothetical protein